MEKPDAQGDARSRSRYQPPKAIKRPHTHRSPFGRREDPWHWLRDDTRQNPDVIAHLSAEVAATSRWYEPLEHLRMRLLAEHASRVPAEESDLPVLERGYWYQARYASGAEHPVYVRWPCDGGVEEILFDVGEAATSNAAYSVGAWDVSDDGRYFAVTEDRRGDLHYQLRIIDRQTGLALPEPIQGVDPDVVFLGDGSLLYLKQDPVTLLGYQVMRHIPGTHPNSDALLYEEPDNAYTLELERSRSGQMVFLYLRSSITNEIRYLSWSHPAAGFAIAVPRSPGHEYDLEDADQHFLMLTNDAAEDFRLIKAPIGSIADRGTWQEILPERPGTVLAGCAEFGGSIVVEERIAGISQLRLIDHAGATDRILCRSEPAASLWMEANVDASLRFLRYAWGSLAHPTTHELLNLETGATQVLRVDPVGGGHRPEDYVVERRDVTVRDGTRVPVTLLRRSAEPLPAAPLLLTAYGAYGECFPTGFDRSILPLVDRGVVYGIAHVRGGGEYGRKWYDAGRLRHKRRTFDDFMDIRRALVDAGDADPQRCAAVGASAGGLVMGVVANEAPTEFQALVAQVPFVDVLSTMLDEDLPLTTLEYEEWGDPARDRQSYHTLLQYSPYDNLRPQAYPALLVIGALHDSQVQYWECAKWVARMREYQTADAPILLSMNLKAGHAGATGRFSAHEERVLEQAFLIDRLRLSEEPLWALAPCASKSV